MGRCIVFVHPVNALFGLVERDAKDIVATQNFCAVVEPRRKGEFWHDKHRPLLAELSEKWQRLGKNPTAYKGPALRFCRRIEALKVACHGNVLSSVDCTMSANVLHGEEIRSAHETVA